MVYEAREQSMAWMETDYKYHSTKYAERLERAFRRARKYG